MPRRVQIGAGYSQIALGEGVYSAGDQTTVSDEEYAALTAAGRFAEGMVVDLGAVGPEGDEVWDQQAAVAALGALTSTDVTAANATNPAAGTYTQAQITALAVLANETKADFNALRADVEAQRAKVNAILAALSGSGRPLAT